jgi:hypothetical protein
MRALDQLKKAANLTPTKKSVNLNDGTVFEFYSTPLTMAEREKAQKDAGGDDANAFALRLLIQKAQDAAGQQMFMPGEIAELKNDVRDEDLQAIMVALIKNESEPLSEAQAKK